MTKTKAKPPQWPADKVERRSVDSLIPYARNARTHSDTQVSQIAGSIKEWGWTTPVLIDEDGGIIAGHGRVLAAQKLGITDVPTMTATGWTEAQKRAYILADNQLALNAGWDMELLKVELGDLDDDGFDVDLIGFDPDFLANLLIDGTEGLTDPDDVPETPDDPITVEGDVWVMGNHRLMCGDSTMLDSVERLIDGGKADMVFTDPPYGVNYSGKKKGMLFAGKQQKKDSGKPIKSDDERGEGLSSLFRDSMLCCVASTKTGAAFYVFFGINRSPETLSGIDAAGLEIRNWLIWDKGNVGFHAMGAQYKPNYEAFLYCYKAKNSPAWYGADNEQTLWRHTSERLRLHPTMKPVSLIIQALENSSKAGDAVLDLFGGSGSTVIACEKAGRDCRVMELDPNFCDVAVKRWQEFTGQDAIHETTKQTFNEMSNDRSKAAA